MRLNRGTIVLIVALIVVIALVLLINQNQATAPGATSVPTAEQVALLPGIDVASLTRLEVRDNLTGQRTVLTKPSADGTWLISETSALSAGSSADVTQMNTLTSLLTTLQTADTFESDQLADFGLVNPQYTVLVTTQAGAVYLLHIGAQSRINPRYYVIVEEAAEGDLPTPEVSAIGTAEPLSGAEQLGAAGDNIQGTELGEITPEVTEVAPVANVTQAQIVGEAIEATNAAVGTQVAQEAAATVEAGATAEAADATPEATVDSAVVEATAEATADATVEVAATPLATAIPEPLVLLSGTYRVYLVQKTTVDRFIALITVPPVAVPTAAPTSDLPLLQVTDASVGPTPGAALIPEVTAIPEAPIDATAEAAPEAAPEATPEATAAS